MSMENSEAATKGDLMVLEESIKGDLVTLEERMKGGLVTLEERMITLEQRMKGDLVTLENRMSDRIEERIDGSKMEMLERMELIETRLLTAFQAWAVPVNGRLRKLEVGDAGLGERLAAIEDRLMALERRRA